MRFLLSLLCLVYILSTTVIAVDDTKVNLDVTANVDLQDLAKKTEVVDDVDNLANMVLGEALAALLADKKVENEEIKNVAENKEDAAVVDKDDDDDVADLENVLDNLEENNENEVVDSKPDEKKVDPVAAVPEILNVAQQVVEKLVDQEEEDEAYEEDLNTKSEEVAKLEEAKPVAEVKPAEVVKPAEEKKVEAEEVVPIVEKKVEQVDAVKCDKVEDAKPVAEVKPAEVVKTAEEKKVELQEPAIPVPEKKVEQGPEVKQAEVEKKVDQVDAVKCDKVEDAKPVEAAKPAKESKPEENKVELQQPSNPVAEKKVDQAEVPKVEKCIEVKPVVEDVNKINQVKEELETIIPSEAKNLPKKHAAQRKPKAKHQVKDVVVNQEDKENQNSKVDVEIDSDLLSNVGNLLNSLLGGRKRVNAPADEQCAKTSPAVVA